MNKYSLTKNTKELFGRILFQIKAEVSFEGVIKGELGGYIEKEENLSQKGDAWIFGDARVCGDAWIFGNAWIYGDAQVFGNAWIYGDARVYGDAQVCGDARVYGDAQVCAKASFTKGRFVGGDDSGKITDITTKTGSTFWNNQYVLGDYEINPIDATTKETIEIGGIKYDKTEVEERLKDIKPVK